MTGLVIQFGRDQLLRREIPHGIPILTVNEDEEGDLLQTVQLALSFGSDCLVTWGLPNLKDLRSKLEVPIIHVSHTAVAQHQFTEEQIHANFLAAVSESAAKVFPDSLRRHHEVEIIHNGVDVERTRPRFGGKFIRKAWGIPEDENTKLVLYLGRLSEEKNPAALLRTGPLLPDNYRIAVVGWGSLADELINSTGPNCCRKVDEHSVSNILFPKPTTGHVGDMLDATNCLVLPSHTEAFPLSLIEAWQATVPVVSTQYPSLAEIENTYGEDLCIKVPLQPTPEVLADAIRRACELPRDHEMIRNAFFAAFAQLTASAMCARWEDYLHRCVQAWREDGVYGQVQYAQPGSSPSLSETAPIGSSWAKTEDTDPLGMIQEARDRILSQAKPPVEEKQTGLPEDDEAAFKDVFRQMTGQEVDINQIDPETIPYNDETLFQGMGVPPDLINPEDTE